MSRPVTLLRVPVKMHLPPDCEKVTPVIIREREWESASTQWILEKIQRGDTFIDVGAHAGYYSLIVAKCLGETGRVFAFEPDPTNFAILKQNVELNNFQNITIEQKAVADQTCLRRLFLSETNSGDHRLSDDGERRSVEVDCVSLDEYMGGKGPVDCMKIDTQGAEVQVLMGMRYLVRANPQLRLLIEFWPFGLDRMGSNGGALLLLLEHMGFGVSHGEMGRLLAAYTIENRRHVNLMLERTSFGAEA